MSPAAEAPRGVVFISRLAPPYYSGAGQAVLMLAKTLAARGVPCQLLATRRRGDSVPAQEKLGENLRIRRFTIRWHHYTAPTFHLFCALWLLWNHRHYEVIQFGNMPLRWRPLRWVARLLGKPVCLRMTAVGLDDLQSLQEKLGTRRMRSFRDVSAYLLISETFRHRSLPFVDDPDSLRVVPKLIDCERFRPASVDEKRRLAAQLGFAPGEQIILFSGVLNARKRPDLLCRALPLIREQVPTARLVLMGPGAKWDGSTGEHNQDYPRQLRTLIDELGISDHCQLTGKVDDVENYYRAADVMVLPSSEEGVPTALLEAMACGLPTVITDAGWLSSDIVKDGSNMLVVSADVEAIARTVCRLLLDDDAALRLGVGAREFMEHHHSSSAVAPILLRFYQYALGSRTGSGPD